MFVCTKFFSHMRLLCTGSTLALGLAAPAAAAQPDLAQKASDPAAGSTDASGSENIIVTARRREESLQNVPVAITAFSGEALREKNLVSTADLPFQTAGMTTRPSQLNREASDFFIRGQGVTLGTAASVVTYFAEVPNFPSTVGGTVDFYDIRSVQVLKGPQGTLFGRSTTGGAVLVEPVRPGPEFGGFVEAKMGNYDYREITGALNIPIIADTIMLRVAGRISRRDGFTTSTTTGQKLDSRHRDYYRIGLLVKPTDWLSNYILFYGRSADETPTSTQIIDFNPSLGNFNTSATGAGRAAVTGLCGAISAPAAVAGCISTRLARLDEARNLTESEFNRIKLGGDQAVRSRPTSFRQYSRGTDQVLQNTTTVDFGKTPLGDLTFKNIFATPRSIRVGQLAEFGVANTATAFYGHEPNAMANGMPGIADRSGTTKFLDRIYNESQLSGSSGSVDWLVGYMIDREKRPVTVPVIFPVFNNAFTVPLDVLTFQSRVAIDTTTDYRGIFGQATLRLDGLVPGLSVTGGARNSTTKSSSFEAITSLNTQLGSGVLFGPATPRQGLSEKAFTYTFSVDYRVNLDLLVYAATRKGYKPGGNNVIGTNPIPGTVPTYTPEYVQDYEVGTKYRWQFANVSGTSNIAAWYQDYTDIQRFQLLTRPTAPFDTSSQTNNIADARLYGFELENNIRVGTRLTLTANYAYLNAKYTKFPGSRTSVRGVTTLQINAPYSNAPKHQFTLGARYELVKSADLGDVALSADLYRQSSAWVNDNVVLSYPETPGFQKAWNNVNLRADWTNLLGRGIDAALFVRNATDDVHLVGANSFIDNLGFVAGVYNEPRTYGFELRYRFGAG